MLEAARALGRQIVFVYASYERPYEEAFATIVEKRVGGLIVGAFPFAHKIVELATHYRIPTIYPRRDYVEAGGLMSYAAGYGEVFRQVGIYTGRILKGEKPADLPVILPSKFELIINLNAAKALGLQVPPMLLARADEVANDPNHPSASDDEVRRWGTDAPPSCPDLRGWGVGRDTGQKRASARARSIHNDSLSVIPALNIDPADGNQPIASGDVTTRRVPSFQRRANCGKCGGKRVDVRPNWKEAPVRPTKLRFD